MKSPLLRVLHVGETWTIGARIGMPEVEYESGSDQDGSILGGVETSVSLHRWSRVGVLGRLAMDIGEADVALPLGPTELEWFQADFMVGASFLPALDVAYAVSPVAGIGYRLVDGFHDFDSGITQEFDASLPYAFVGANWHQCLGTSSRWTADAMLMVGELEGFQIGLTWFF